MKFIEVKIVLLFFILIITFGFSISKDGDKDKVEAEESNKSGDIKGNVYYDPRLKMIAKKFQIKKIGKGVILNKSNKLTFANDNKEDLNDNFKKAKTPYEKASLIGNINDFNQSLLTNQEIKEILKCFGKLNLREGCVICRYVIQKMYQALDITGMCPDIIETQLLTSRHREWKPDPDIINKWVVLYNMQKDYLNKIKPGVDKLASIDKKMHEVNLKKKIQLENLSSIIQFQNKVNDDANKQNKKHQTTLDDVGSDFFNKSSKENIVNKNEILNLNMPLDDNKLYENYYNMRKKINSEATEKISLINKFGSAELVKIADTTKDDLNKTRLSIINNKIGKNEVNNDLSLGNQGALENKIDSFFSTSENTDNKDNKDSKDSLRFKEVHNKNSIINDKIDELKKSKTKKTIIDFKEDDSIFNSKNNFNENNIPKEAQPLLYSDGILNMNYKNLIENMKLPEGQSISYLGTSIGTPMIKDDSSKTNMKSYKNDKNEKTENIKSHNIENENATEFKYENIKLENDKKKEEENISLIQIKDKSKSQTQSKASTNEKNTKEQLLENEKLSIRSDKNKIKSVNESLKNFLIEDPISYKDPKNKISNPPIINNNENIDQINFIETKNKENLNSIKNENKENDPYSYFDSKIKVPPSVSQSSFLSSEEKFEYKHPNSIPVEGNSLPNEYRQDLFDTLVKRNREYNLETLRRGRRRSRFPDPQWDCVETQVVKMLRYLCEEEISQSFQKYCKPLFLQVSTIVESLLYHDNDIEVCQNVHMCQTTSSDNDFNYELEKDEHD